VLIQRATLLDGTVADVRVGREVKQVAERLTPVAGEEVLDAAHRTLIPGLHDHHVHMHSAAAALTSVRVGPREAGSREALRGILAAATVGTDGWIRAIGYHEAVAGPLDRNTLDDVAPDVPVRVQHRSGVLWTLNSAGLARVGLPDHPDGRLRSADPHWSDSLQRRETGLAEVSRRLASYGVTGVTDATPDFGPDDAVKFAEAFRSGELLQRVHSLAPGKVILHDDGLDVDGLAAWIANRHADGGGIAVHCVTAAQLVVTLAAIRAAGPRRGDRIEHAAVVPDDCLADLAELGLTVVTQPNFVAERGDQYLLDVPHGERAELWRYASLLTAGVPVAMSTDFPFGDADPWAAMRAAVRRRTAAGERLGPDEGVTASTALSGFLGSPEDPLVPRSVTPGRIANLCMLAASPEEVLCDLEADMVAGTVVEGRLVYERAGPRT
jgi:predicted amidohydrolase YtcJ